MKKFRFVILIFIILIELYYSNDTGYVNDIFLVFEDNLTNLALDILWIINA